MRISEVRRRSALTCGGGAARKTLERAAHVRECGKDARGGAREGRKKKISVSGGGKRGKKKRRGKWGRGGMKAKQSKGKAVGRRGEWRERRRTVDGRRQMVEGKKQARMCARYQRRRRRKKQAWTARIKDGGDNNEWRGNGRDGERQGIRAESKGGGLEIRQRGRRGTEGKGEGGRGRGRERGGRVKKGREKDQV
ncbi:hypothetical protein B0H11DRAFT_2046841 [Mycena galericulata]|nr:hypothetical protein B0H11DRAFT_2046841 [Mycena galericulata]